MKKRLILPASIILLTFLYVRAGDDKNEVQATLRSVTVYRSGAEMVHNATASLKAGTTILVIDNISNSIDINSVQIKAPAAITILGFEFSNNYIVNQEKTPRMQLLEDSLQHVQENISRLDLSINNTAELLEVLRPTAILKANKMG